MGVEQAGPKGKRRPRRRPGGPRGGRRQGNSLRSASEARQPLGFPQGPRRPREGAGETEGWGLWPPGGWASTPATLQQAWPGVPAAPAPPGSPRGALLQGGPEHPTGSLSIHLSGSWQLRYLEGDTGRPRPRPLGSGDVLPALPGGPSHVPLPVPPSKLLLDTQETQAI